MIVGSQEFAEPGSCEKHYCEGRLCAKCHKCRDWHFSGDQAEWDWVCNFRNWDDKDKKRWDDGRYKLFTRRDGATCEFVGGDLGPFAYGGGLGGLGRLGFNLGLTSSYIGRGCGGGFLFAFSDDHVCLCEIH